ncbi:hypothetical protein [Sulfitobacter geojensis]|jgi:hypothetical protein|uniref:Beta/gamma crystallin 'Greek key' domain-containing protein n=1 Tax=Sulfitobacter geojensis TaxID=1342299 RepID=A0AAE2VUX9_9RHOB|nr:hypothetical protein [Sulfitobacter geojensis]KHA52884.1 hypothetical protein Z947_3194 [Sulfitobacter geojensis]MBM1687788.1 hypothetical protein [Sulfitobacter geojensis]MBM1691855.1 hypothetical protein [Sulfitobacter geojensis]MBM1704021.1 hypothetical protein [Sulfitobacter geojensis]MBM1708079.1 hypothetical protein [Sulfitobacter geojensis]
MKTLALLLALCAAPLAAQQTMTADEFDAYTKGKTLFYGKTGQAYGAEIYHENRRVEWSFLDGDCKEGEWYEADGLICFVYENNPNPQCWSFIKGANGLIARFENRPDTTELYEANEGAEKMLCLGPKVGV